MGDELLGPSTGGGEGAHDVRSPKSDESHIFINYRHDDSAGQAGHIYERLAEHFGHARTFLDLEALSPGEDYVEGLERAIERCAVLLVVIGRNWLSMTGRTGQRRIDEANDFVRLEIEAALKYRTRVIPVLVDGAAMPEEDELPEGIASLSRRHAAEIRNAPSEFAFDVSRLIERLERVVPAGAEESVAAPPGGARSNRRWALLGGVAAVVAAAIAVTVVALGAGSAHHGQLSANHGHHGPPHGTAGHLFTDGAIPVGDSPDGIAIDNGRIWVANAGDGTVKRIDQISATVVGTTRFASHSVIASPMAVWKTAIWVADAAAGTVTKIDAVTGSVVRGPITIGGHPAAMVGADGDIWVANPDSNTVTRFNAVSGTPVGSPIRVGSDPKRMALDQQTILVANSGDGTVTRIDAASGQVLGTIRVGDHPNGINSAAGDIWVANSDNNTVSRINAASGTPVGSPIRVGRDPRRVVANPVWVWVANAGDGTVTRIDARTGRVLGTIRVGGHPDVMTIAGDLVWVASWSQPTVHPGGVPGTVTRIVETSGRILAAPLR